MSFNYIGLENIEGYTGNLLPFQPTAGAEIKSTNNIFRPDKGGFPAYGGNGISGYHGKFMFEQPVIVIGRVGVYCGAVHLSEPKSWVTDNARYICELKDDFDEQSLVVALRVANFDQYAGRAAQPLVSGNRIYPVSILVPACAATAVRRPRDGNPRLASRASRQPPVPGVLVPVPPPPHLQRRVVTHVTGCD